jgi:hypothetical protein
VRAPSLGVGFDGVEVRLPTGSQDVLQKGKRELASERAEVREERAPRVVARGTRHFSATERAVDLAFAIAMASTLRARQLLEEMLRRGEGAPPLGVDG